MILVALALAADPGNGAVLAGLAGCHACHTSDGADFAGGHPVETPFGTFYGSNLTPTGLAGWTFEDFERAMRTGRSPEGHAYWPAFPYEDFQLMTESDLRDLWAFLQTVEPDPTPSLPHDGPAGWKRWAWRTLYFERRTFEGDRGQYLVDAVGHCGACHTPRSKRGVQDRKRYLEGGTPPFSKAPPIDREALASWDETDLVTFLEMGMLPDGDFTGRGMFRVVEEGTSKLSDEDRRAIASWLLGR